MNWLLKLFPVLMATPPAGADTWQDSLPENVRAWDEVTNSDTPEKFWEQMANMRSRLGRSITIPGEDAGSQDWEKFNTKLLAKVPTLMPKPDAENQEQMNIVYKALGLPDTPDKYTVPEYDKHGMATDDSMIDTFRKIAHDAKLNDKQFQHIVKTISEHNIEKAVEAQGAADADVAKLKTEWGAAYDQNYTAVKTFLHSSGAPTEVQDLANKGKLSSSMAKWFLDQQKAVAGQQSADFTQDTGSPGGIMTPEEAQEKIDAIMNNKDHAYWNRSAKGNEAARKRMVELHRLANPPKST